MADVARSLRFVGVTSGRELDRLDRLDDGTIRPALDGPGGIARTVLSSRVRFEEETEAEAFAFLAENGWSNTTVMVALDDLDAAHK